jgi:cytochrome c5
MRAVPAQMGAARNHRGPQSMSEMQKPVLEHTAPETRQENEVIDRTCAFCHGTGVDPLPKTSWELEEWIQTGRTLVCGEYPAAM